MEPREGLITRCYCAAWRTKRCRLRISLLQRHDVPMEWNASQLGIVADERCSNRGVFCIGERERPVAFRACDTRSDCRIRLLKNRRVCVVDPVRDVNDVRQRRQQFDATLPGC